MLPQVGTLVDIQSYKHDGRLHRCWAGGYVLQADPARCVVVTDKTLVTDEDGRQWYTREPALCYFFPADWYNVIAMIREYGIYYYCNLASPALFDGEAVKYIDYDLDYKIYPDGRLVLLDEDEYAAHSQQMHYPPALDGILRRQMDGIVAAYAAGRGPFDTHGNDELFQQYLDSLARQ